MLVHLGCVRSCWFAYWTDRITSARWISGAQQINSIIIISEGRLMEGRNKGSSFVP